MDERYYNPADLSLGKNVTTLIEKYRQVRTMNRIFSLLVKYLQTVCIQKSSACDHAFR